MSEKKSYVPPTPPDIQEDIEIFRKEEESAQQTFFYIGIRDLLSKRPDILAAVNRNSMFWLTTNHALFVSTFIWLGRIFDTKSAHNVGLLLKAVEQNLPQFDREALRKRKEAFITPAQAADYVKEKHDTAIDDVRELRKQVRECVRSMSQSTVRSATTSRTTKAPRTNSTRCWRAPTSTR